MAFRIVLPCYICNRQLAPRLMPQMNGENNVGKREIAIFRRTEQGRPPVVIDAQTRICHICNNSINEELAILNRDPTCCRLNVLTQTQRQTCLICNAPNDIHRLSLQARVNVFVHCNIFIPDGVRSCPHHLDERGFLLKIFQPILQSINRAYVIKGQELQAFLQELRANASNSCSFDNENDINEDDFQVLTSLSTDQFSNLFSFCDPVPIENGNRYVCKKDLIMFLCKLRHGMSDNYLKIIFMYSSRQAVSLSIDTVRQSLMLRFVPQNIGFHAINREHYIEQHVTDFANILYNPNPNDKKAILYIDGTYNEIEKSSNFRVLRQSYCIHKGHHLVKPVLIVAPNGYIVDVQGPYFSDYWNNDAALLRNEFERDIDGMRLWLQPNDILIVDRGYRDAIPLLEDLNIRYHMPRLLERGQNQFTTEEANASRLVTKTRWIVEARNGHIKSVFKFLAQPINTSHLPNLGSFYRIAGALINRYRDPILMQDATAEKARELLQRTQEPNIVQALVEVENLRRRRGQWVDLDHNQVVDFPHLTLEYIKDLAVGTFQVELAPSYVQDSMQRNEENAFVLDIQENGRGMIRVKIYSRFRHATSYQLWIAYLIGENDDDDDDDEQEDSILGYYCTCKSGARTLGTCVHIVTVIWFLGHARHHEGIKYPSTRLLNDILDAAGRPMPLNVNDGE